MKPLTILVLVFTVCSSFANPIEEDIPNQQKTALETLTNPKLLVEQLVNSLRAAAKEANDAVDSFEYSLNKQAEVVREKSALNLLNLQNRVSSAAITVLQKITNSAIAVQYCVNAQRTAAETIDNNTLSNIANCTIGSLSDFASLVQELRVLSNSALSFAEDVILRMQNCISTNTGSVINTSICLTNLVISSQAQGLFLITTSAIQVGRLSLALASITTAMEACVTSQLVYATIATGEIILEIGACSAASVVSVLVNP